MTKSEPETGKKTDEQSKQDGVTSVRTNAEQEAEERAQMRAAEAYAPPAGVGVVIDPDEQWRKTAADN